MLERQLTGGCPLGGTALGFCLHRGLRQKTWKFFTRNTKKIWTENVLQKRILSITNFTFSCEIFSARHSHLNCSSFKFVDRFLIRVCLQLKSTEVYETQFKICLAEISPMEQIQKGAETELSWTAFSSLNTEKIKFKQKLRGSKRKTNMGSST